MRNAVRGNADSMVASGMAALGYTYVDIDDCWMAPSARRGRAVAGRPEALSQRYQDARRLRARQGFKLGIYASAGTATCQNLPGSLDHENTDAATFAEWGVDLVKYDNCYNPGRAAVERFTAMGNALKASGRDIVYSISDWGDEQSWRWASNAGGHYWRTCGDITDSWDAVVVIVEQQVGLAGYSRPHGWNDPDMLEGGQRRHDHRRVPRPRQPVGVAQRAPDRRQRPAIDGCHDARPADQPRGDRGRPKLGAAFRATRWPTSGISRSGPNRCRPAVSQWCC